MKHVYVESIVFDHLDDGLGYWSSTKPWEEGDTPDAAMVATTWHLTNSDWYCHSTSWRVLNPESIVLTYGILPPSADALESLGFAGAATPLQSPLTQSPDQGESPASRGVGLTEVAWHAARHFAFLRATEPDRYRPPTAWADGIWRSFADLPVDIARALDRFGNPSRG